MPYSVLINTCDKFEDCWNPFFKLFKLYWPECSGKLYLNTEYKDFSYRGLAITPVRGCARNGMPRSKRATWSQCLIWALEQIDTDVILYMQEDYFLKDYVKNEIVEQYVHLMEEHPEIKCLHLTDQAVRADGLSDFSRLNKVKVKQRYRVSCQAALWRKEELMQVARIHESAWQFEEFGSKRSSVLNHLYLVVSNEYVRLNEFEIIPYLFTGIVQGRWLEETVPLFERHGIEMDFTQRGFLKNAPKKPLRKKIAYRFAKWKCIWKNYIEIKKIQEEKCF